LLLDLGGDVFFFGSAVGLVGEGFVFENELGVFVGEFGGGVDDGVDEFGVEGFAVFIEVDDGAFGEAIGVGFEGAEAVGEGFGEHGDDAVDEVGGVASGLGFAVEGGAGFDVVGDVSDVDGEDPVCLHSS